MTADPVGRPTEPAPCRWAFAEHEAVAGEDLVAVGADLEPATLLAAYRHGMFPMGAGSGSHSAMGWWSPWRRGVLGPGDLHISRSLARSVRSFDVRVDTAFDAVLSGCADQTRPGGWITPPMAAAYRRLHSMGWAHSVEVFDGQGLAGGLYGVSIGALFAGESMFHRRTDASKVALVALVDHLERTSPVLPGPPQARWLVDVQWRTPHLATLGVREMSRAAYLALLPTLVGGAHRWPGARDRHPKPSGPARGPAR
ncbi:MAG: leucyl/phenylalanyl-tRNA--protein transferase [Ornithinimicrobium sp.]